MANRTGNGYRPYTDRDVHTLRSIHRARDLGFSIEGIRHLLALWSDTNRSSAEVQAQTLEHIDALQLKIAELKTMKQALEHLIAHCQGDDRPDCPIVDDLAQHGAQPSNVDRKASLH
ncbi:MerR family DNA-binding protein [Phyllobacterium sp. LjRoot231]|uniref:MerR family DNA-binding protein n=1 Tax=Phyllobacterium sp. LjRoot231 TaxID=3342289 RepID=UPI003ECDDE76